MKKSKISHPNTAWFLHEQGKLRREILEEMSMVYGMSAFQSRVYKWIGRFEGWDNYEETVRTCRTKSSGPRSNGQLIERILDECRHATARELEERGGIPIKHSSRYSRRTGNDKSGCNVGPQNFYQMNKSKNGRVNRVLLKSWRSEKFLLDCIVTGDKTWFH